MVSQRFQVYRKTRRAYSDAVLLIRDTVGCDGWVMTMFDQYSVPIAQGYCSKTNLTCSETSFVVPASSSHFPRNSSPRNGFNGFFSEPSLSLLLQYCDFNTLKYHLNTSRARLAGSFSAAGATKIVGCSVQ